MSADGVFLAWNERIAHLIMAESYKARKEAFVSNLSGSSVWDIHTVSAVVPVSIRKFTGLSSSRLKVLLANGSLGRVRFYSGPSFNRAAGYLLPMNYRP